MLFGPGGMGAGGSPWGAPAPRDTRPPEEIYATQLGQLNGMVSAVKAMPAVF
jgi:ubiquilin